MPALAMVRSEKLARPLGLVATVVVPARTAELTVSVTATPACATVLPILSVSCTVTGGVMTAPATALEGCWTNTRWLAEATTLVSAKLVGVAIPVTDAVTV